MSSSATPGTSEAIGRLGWAALPVGAAAALALVPAHGGPTVCPFALITGTACPGCGLTRAAAALVRGDVEAALSFHPLILLVLVWLVGVWIAGFYRRSGRPFPVDPSFINRLLILTGVVFGATWVLRLTTGSLPPV